MLNRSHPRYIDHKEKTKRPYNCFTCCKFHVGSNTFCSTSKKPKDVDQYGPAMMLYFRFLKSTISFILFAAVINSILVYLYTEAYDQSKSEDTSSIQEDNFILAMRDWSLTGSLGGYTYGSSRFYEANFSSPSQLNSSLNNLTSSYQNSIAFECPKGVIDITQKYTYIGLIMREFPSAYTFFMFEKEFNNDTNFYKSIANCSGKQNCSVNYTADWFTAGANDYIMGTNGKTKHKLYLKYHCTDIKLTYFGQKYAKSDLNYVVIIINFITLGAFLIYLLSWAFYEKKIFEKFITTHPYPTDYTLKIKNLPQEWDQETLGQNLYEHLMKHAKLLEIKGEPIVDINVAKNNSILHLDQLIRKYDIKCTAIVQNFLSEKVIEEPPQGTQLDIRYFMEYMLTHPDKFKDGKVEQEVKTLMKEVKKKQTYEEKKEKASKRKETFQSVFVTFNTNVNKVKFYNAMNISKSKRMSLNCFGTKGHVNAFHSKILAAKNAPEPVNISWENLQVGPVEKKVRRFISWVSTILLIGIPIIVVVLISINIKKNETFKFSCPNIAAFGQKGTQLDEKTKNVLIADYTAQESENLMFCYCYADFRGRLNT